MTKRYCLLVAALLGLSFGFASAAEQDPASFLASAPSGERTDLRIEVPAGETDGATYIPLTVLKGDEPGPTVLMVAGVHGYEFASILAAQQLSVELDPTELTGTLLLVRAAHVPAFENRTPYVNPYDRKNLNRSFPGNPEGTQTERIAHALSTQIIPLADFVLDVHSGDGAEWLEAFVGVYGGPLATDYTQALAFAEAMAFPNIVRYQMMTQAQIDRGRSLNRQAVAQGLPTVLVEIGQNGSRDEAHVQAIIDGLKRGLEVLGVLSEAPPVPDHPIQYFDNTQSVPVSLSGIWSPVIADGRFVEKGEILGTISSFDGNEEEVVAAPISGFGLYGLAGPPVRAGESVMTIAIPASRESLLQ